MTTTPAGSYGRASLSTAFLQAYVDAQVAGVLDTAPETLNTLNELAAAINDDPAFFSTMASANSTLQSNIDTLTSNAAAARSALQTALQTAIDAVQADVDQNETDGDAAVTAEATARGAALTALDNALQGLIAAVQADVDQNESDADAADLALSNRLNTLEADPTTATALAAVQADVDQNEADADAADAALSGRLDTLEADPTTAAAVAAVQADVDQNEADADAAIALRAPLASPTFTGLLTSPAIDLVNDNVGQVGFDLHNNISNQYAADVSTNNWGIRVISSSTNAGSSVLDVRTGDGVAFRVDNDQSIHLDGGLTDAADDTAAAAAGVAVNQLYRNGSVVMIRVS